MAMDERDDGPGVGEQTGEALGGVSGTLAGAALGATGGPVATIIGGIAGAIGGWWAGEEAGETLDEWSDDDEAAYREHFESYGDHAPLVTGYDQAHAGYVVGHLAARNPDYRKRPFDEVEEELMYGWEDEEYAIMRPYVREGYERSADLHW